VTAAPAGPLVVLDAAAFDVLDTADGVALRALMERAVSMDGEVRCAAVTLAEVCRGSRRTRRIEAALSRRGVGRRVLVEPTDENLAKLVGAILHDSRSDGAALADAHVVAVAATHGDAAVVVTQDPDDITRLSAAVPGCRITTRRPDLTR
jgi:predicted nucleic acid-binding protein